MLQLSGLDRKMSPIADDVVGRDNVNIRFRAEGVLRRNCCQDPCPAKPPSRPQLNDLSIEQYCLLA